MDFCYPLPRWSFIVHTACTTVSLLLILPALLYAARIENRFVLMTPTLCLALAYENLLLVLPNHPYCSLGAQRVGWIMNAIIPPLFLVASFETGYVVHKHRSVKYLGINFDEGKRVDTSPCSWFLRNLTRLISLALLFMGLAVNFSLFFPHSSDNAGMSGYLGLGRVDHAHYYVSLVPSLVFSVVSLIIAATIQRYGKHSTLLIPRSCGWSWMLLGAVLQTAGQFPASSTLYPPTSMAGYTAFLVCIVCTHGLVLKDMGEAERITEFLRRQRAVQQQLAATCVLREGMRARRREDAAAAEARGEGGEAEVGRGKNVLVNGHGGRRRRSSQYHHHHQEQQEQQEDAGGVEGRGGGEGGGGGGGPGPMMLVGVGAATVKMVRRLSGGKGGREGGNEGGFVTPSSVEMASTAVVVTAAAEESGEEGERGGEEGEEGGEGGEIGGRGGDGGSGGGGLLRRVSTLFERQTRAKAAASEMALAALEGKKGGRNVENGYYLEKGGDGESAGDVIVTMETLDVRIGVHEALPPPQGGEMGGASEGYKGKREEGRAGFPPDVLDYTSLKGR